MKRNNKRNRYTILLVILLLVSIGYALIYSQLKMTGTANLSKAVWSVHWGTPAVTEGSVSETAPTLTQDQGEPANTKLVWNVTFDLPSDFYEFTVDAVNEGDMDVKLVTVNLVDGNNDLPYYISYSIKYVDGTAPVPGDVLAKATKSGNTVIPTTKAYKVRVWYDERWADADSINNMSSGASYDFALTVKYEQLVQGEDPTNGDDPSKPLLERIAKNPDRFRNSEQHANNKDIGIDDEGNIINLDWWVGKKYCTDVKAYYYNEYTDTIWLGENNCSGIFTMATSNEQLVNGKMVTVIPSYIYLASKKKVYPVTGVDRILARGVSDYSLTFNKMTQLPDIPSTFTEISPGMFSAQGITSLEIPSHIKSIGAGAFSGNNLTGNLVIPRTVESIGQFAFKGNNLTSVSIPTTTTFYENCVNVVGGYSISCDSFDDGVIINRY